MEKNLIRLLGYHQRMQLGKKDKVRARKKSRGGKVLADQEKFDEFCLDVRALIDATLPVSLP